MRAFDHEGVNVRDTVRKIMANGAVVDSRCLQRDLRERFHLELSLNYCSSILSGLYKKGEIRRTEKLRGFNYYK